MINSRAGDASYIFRRWLSDWRRFYRTASIGGQLAVLNSLAALIPESPYSILDEIGQWAQRCRVTAQWDALRSAFEESLWPLLPTLEICQEEMPRWYVEAFFRMAVPYRRAALLVSFLDFLLLHLGEVDGAPLRRFQEWLIDLADWTYRIESAALPSGGSISRALAVPAGSAPLARA